MDGQQRLTTVTIILECIRQRLERDGESDEAAEVGRFLSAKPLARTLSLQLAGEQALARVSRDSGPQAVTM